MESIQKIYKSHLAAATLTLSASLPFAGAAHADVKYFEQDVNPATAQYVAENFEKQGKNVAVLYRGKPMSTGAENSLKGMLRWMQKHRPHFDIAVVGGGDHQGVIGYFGSEKIAYDEIDIRQQWMHDDIERRLEDKAVVHHPSPQ